MIKIIDLGCEVPETGESLVQLVDETLVKTASNDIQDYWSSLDKDSNKSYLHVIAMTDSTKYGPNNNGDFFYGDDLRKYHHTFTENAHIFLHHVNKDPKKSIGKPIYSFYNENMHRVELILAIDKSTPLAKDTIEKIKNDEDIFVSMGVRVSHDICSICGNKAKTRKEYCEHLRYNMKKILPDGRQVYSINPAPLKFFDISIVRKPADKVAWALEKAASDTLQSAPEFVTPLSADLGEQYELEKVARESLQKLSEIVKYVDGDITKVKDSSDNVKDSKNLEVIRNLKAQNIKHLDYHAMSFKDMEDTNLSPGGLLKGLRGCAVSPTLGELAFASGRHHMGQGFTTGHMSMMFKMLPAILRMLEHNPSRIYQAAAPILNDVQEDFDSPEIIIRIKKHVQPVAARRIMFLKTAGMQEGLEKTAGEVLKTLPVSGSNKQLGITNSSLGSFDQLNIVTLRDKATHGVGTTDHYSVTGDDGKVYNTNAAAIFAAKSENNTPKDIENIVGATIGLASLGAIVSGHSSLEKVLGIPGAVLAAKLLLNKSETVMTHQGLEIPANTAFTQARDSLTKTANAISLGASHMWPTMAMAVPSALGLDYLYNKNIRFKHDPSAEYNMSTPEKWIHKGGKFVVDHPALTVGLAGVGGAAIRAHNIANATKKLAPAVEQVAKK